MGQRTLDGTDLSRLRRRYQRLIGSELPRAARADGDWPIREDHCFARIVLDHVFGGVWYDHVEGRPAYEHLSASELRAAIVVAERLLDEGRPLVDGLNRASLRRRRTQ